MKRYYGIAGSGRASRHLQAYFRLLKVPFKLWRRSSGLAPKAVLGGCSTVFILINDGAIAPFISANPFLKGKTLIHFSGSLGIKGAFAMHPFMPLCARPLSLKEYRRLPFALDRGVSMRKLVPEFVNPVFRIKKGGRPLYHALCALGANLPVILWQKTMQDLNKKFGIPRGQIQRYFQASLDNFRKDPGRALSGPLSRRDAPTIASDIGALGDDPFAGVYSAFAKIYENN
ncbi:MAG: DUF2520 domain-containing protein [Elusimicrobiota bacterium]|nr:DUF2520 domain-containing protein [Elusimicrobiota bacterium]